MRLLNAKTLGFEEFFESETPPYAILSHTWTGEEVSLQEMLASQSNANGKKGYLKIQETCRLAQDQGLEYAWIDTCCIDKTSSAELTEAINSMFLWYKEAKVCYAFLEDWPPNVAFEDGLRQSRWITRGWTLQELIAPPHLQFYDMYWTSRGTKADHALEISRVTRIPENVLLGTESLRKHSICNRMTWASRRRTTRVEDIAYCLLGIFNVNMPLIYGEGPKSFIRLQEEIVKSEDFDISLLDWIDPESQHGQGELLAPSPRFFRSHIPGDALLKPYGTPDVYLTGQRLQVSGGVNLWLADALTLGRDSSMYLLSLRYTKFPLFSGEKEIFLPLRKLQPDLFRKNGGPIQLDTATDRLYPLFGTRHSLLRSPSLYFPNLDIPIMTCYAAKQNTIICDFMPYLGMPEFLWNVTLGAFVRPEAVPATAERPILIVAYRHRSQVRKPGFIVFCDFQQSRPEPRVLLERDVASDMEHVAQSFSSKLIYRC